MLQYDWLSNRTLSAITVQSAGVVYKIGTLSCFSEVWEEDLEILLDNSIPGKTKRGAEKNNGII